MAPLQRAFPHFEDIKRGRQCLVTFPIPFIQERALLPCSEDSAKIFGCRGGIKAVGMQRRILTPCDRTLSHIDTEANDIIYGQAVGAAFLARHSLRCKRTRAQPTAGYRTREK